MANSKITTGQYVTLTQTPASVGDRMLATIIDWFFIMTYFTLELFIILGLEAQDINDTFLRVMFIVLQIPLIFYFPFCEMVANGQSIGKKIMKTRVVMTDGSTPTLGAYLMRWILYPFDTFVTGGLGLVFILFSKNAQRLGDLAAGTMVVKTKNDDSFFYMGDFSFVHQGYVPSYPEAANFSMRQVDIISRTLYFNSLPHRQELIFRLAGQVQQFLNVNVPPNLPADTFLTTALNDFYYYSSQIEV